MARLRASLDGFCGVQVDGDDEQFDWLNFGCDISLRKYQRGECIVARGEKVDHLLVILEGEISVENNSEVKSKRVITSSEIYGESYFLHRPAVTTVTAIQPCTVVILNLEAEISNLFAKDPLFKDHSKREAICRSPLRKLSESGSQKDIHYFMNQLKVTRVPSNPTSQEFQDGKRRQTLFFHIAKKLVYRLQDSINCSIDLLPSPDFSDIKIQPKNISTPRKLTNELKPFPKKGHKRTPSKTFMGKMLQKAVSKTGYDAEISGKPKGRVDKATDKFIKKFRLPKSEKLMKEFDVALISEDGNPLEGKLFLGLNYLCFLGNGFAFNMKTVTPMAEISSWKISAQQRFIMQVNSENETTKIVYALKDSKGAAALEEFFSNYSTNSQLLSTRPQSLVRKESWVMRHHVDPVASESFDLQDCILLLDCSERHLYKQGDIIVKGYQTHSERGMWKIASGRVKIENKEGNVIAVLGKNSFFGEISFFFPEVASTASIIALDEVVEVFFLHGDKLNGHFNQYPNFGARFYKYISTIVAHRFERFNLLFMSDFADYICRQNIANISVTDHIDVAPHSEEMMVQLTKQFLKFSSAQATLGKISLSELLSVEYQGTEIIIKTRSGSTLTMNFGEKAKQWFLAIDSASFSSYGIKFCTFDAKKELLMSTYVTAEDCEIQLCSGNGTVEEQWFYNPIRGTVISLSVDRYTQCSWNGYLFKMTDPKGKEYPGYGVWDGIRIYWYPNSLHNPAKEEGDFDIHNSKVAKTLVWYDTIMTFQSDVESESFTVHNTKIQKKSTNEFEKALKFKCKEEGPKSAHIVADALTPLPLLLFLSLIRANIPDLKNSL